ncbi:hypothetical protein [Fodinibius halophilus]|uniref:Uncharacterized protein n=1 Tax=Fodinibius halophilus TaxID=1736908 RepID=A0A6M1T835_9BACT|nr:hypothetical protein [Fodinibius halophilus]NGP90239.1 hypothetical protein [Fodinibius halophilus]
MFILHITNNYEADIEFDSTTISAKGGTHSTGKIKGHHTIDGKGLTVFNILDLAKKKIPGYPSLKATWGILFEYQGHEIYGRYEGNGEFDITFNEYGNVEIKAVNGKALEIRLPGLTLEQEKSENN